MSGTALPEGYWRDARWVAGCLALVLLVAFAPFLFGRFTLLTSAWDAPSLYATGATAPPVGPRKELDPVGCCGAPPPPARPLKELDPGGADWQSEAWLQVEHDALYVDHRIPWWDPYDGYGHPFAAAQAQQPFYPLTLLAALRPSPHVWNFYIVVRLYIAGLFAALFVLFYGGRLAALSAAVATSFAGYYLIYYSMPHLSVETLLPAVLWATELLVRRPGTGAIATLGAVIGAVFLGGMPESAAIALLTAALYLLVRIRTAEPAAVPFARIGAFAAANVLGGAIGGIMLLPFIEYLPYAFDTHRNSAGPPVGLGADIWTFGRAVFQRLVPLAYGPPLNSITEPSHNGYSGIRGWFGATVAAAALVAVLDLFRRRVTRPAAFGPIVALAVIAVCALGKTLGAFWINWIGALPLLRLIVFPKYGEVPLDVALALLCGFGIAVFENQRRPESWVPVAAVATVAFGLTAGFLTALAAIPATYAALLLDLSVAFAAALLVATLLVMNLRFRYVAAVLTGIVLVEVIGNYYAPMYGHIAAIPPATQNPYAGAPYVDALRSMTGDGRRVITVGGPLWPEWGGAMRIDTPQALNAMYPRDYFPFLNAFLTRRNPAQWEDLADRFDASSNPSFTTPAAHRWMTLSSVGFVVVPAGHTLRDPHLHAVYARDVTILAYDDPLPRASIFHQVRLAATNDEALRMLADPQTDVHRTVVLSDTRETLPATGPVAGESARIVGRDAGSVTIDATLRAPGVVMLNDTYFPGWTASVDGGAVPIVRADYLFRAVHVAAGSHRIRFDYRSRADAAGTVLTLAGLIAVAALAWLAARRTRNARTRSARISGS